MACRVETEKKNHKVRGEKNCEKQEASEQRRHEWAMRGFVTHETHDDKPHRTRVSIRFFAPLEMSNSSQDERPVVFFDISIGDVPIGRMKMELYSDIVPKTAENFR